MLFKRVSELLKVPMIIENRPGAGGNIAAQELKRAAPDGYTVMYGSSSITTAPALFGRDDLDPTKAFVAASCTAAVPLILLVAKDVDAKDAAGFYKMIADNPGKYFQGSSGNGSIDHLVSMDIASKLKLDFQHVPYKGNGPALTDLAAGTTNFMYSGSFNSAIPFIQSGQVKALAVTSGKRSQALPDVPALAEVVPGLEGYDAGTWQNLLAPLGTPAPILATLNDAVQAAMKDPEVLKSFNFQGAEIMDMTPAQCQDYVAQEWKRWSGTIKALNLNAAS